MYKVMRPPNPLSPNSPITFIEEFDVSQICGAYKNQLDFDVSRLFKDINTVKLYKCAETGYRFFSPFSVIGDAEFYRDLSLHQKNYYSQRWEHLKTLQKIKQKEKVLEIGSGFGAFLELLDNKKIIAEGLELNSEAILVCKSKGLKIHNDLINNFVIKNKDKYDIVCAFQVLEHITEVHDFIKNSIKALKNNGKLIFGVPNNNPYLFINDKYHTLNLPPHHAGLWNEKSLKALTHIFNLELYSMEFEPLQNTYKQFLAAYIKNTNFLKKNMIIFLNRIFPKALKKILCRYIKGRNILVVFIKK